MNLNPDFEIEEFWLGFKQSMINFYNLNNLYRPIELWSNKLNDLQKNKKYEKIEEQIRNFISLYAIECLRQNNTYHTQILITNIKRWNKISYKYKFINKNKTYYNFIFVLLDIFCTLNKSNLDLKELFSQIELFILYQDYQPLIEMAIKYNKPNILDKLIKYDKTLVEYILDFYNLEIERSKKIIISGKKLCDLIRTKNI